MAAGIDLKSQLQGRFRGAFLGAAIGDALAYPHAAESLEFVRALGPDATRRFEAHRNGFHSAGESSLGIQLAIATAETIGDIGEVDSEELAQRFRDLLHGQLLNGRDEVLRAAMERYGSGVAAGDCGAPDGVSSPSFIDRAIVIGLWCHDDQKHIPRAIEHGIEVTHRDRRIVALAGVIAAGVAYAVTHRELILGDFIDDCVRIAAETSGAVADFVEELPRILTLEESAARRVIDAHGLYSEEVPNNRLAALSPVAHGLYSFLRAPSDPRRAMASAFFCPIDRSYAVSLAGGLGGAFGGERSLDADLVSALVMKIELRDCANALYGRSTARRM